MMLVDARSEFLQMQSISKEARSGAIHAAQILIVIPIDWVDEKFELFDFIRS